MGSGESRRVMAAPSYDFDNWGCGEASHVEFSVRNAVRGNVVIDIARVRRRRVTMALEQPNAVSIHAL